MPSVSSISKTLPWRTLAMPGTWRERRAPSMALPCGSRTPDFKVTVTARFHAGPDETTTPSSNPLSPWRLASPAVIPDERSEGPEPGRVGRWNRRSISVPSSRSREPRNDDACRTPSLGTCAHKSGAKPWTDERRLVGHRRGHHHAAGKENDGEDGGDERQGVDPLGLGDKRVREAESAWRSSCGQDRSD